MKKCKDCRGRGRWQMPQETDANGVVYMYWEECNTCHGTGRSQDPEDGQDWDIGGDSIDNE